MKYISVLLILFVSVAFPGCKDDPEDIPQKIVKQMTLVYAVNNNNLSGDLVMNESQMLEAMSKYDTDVYKLLVYKYTPEGAGLYEIKKQGGELKFSLLRQYDNTVLSINPDRVSQVLNDALSEYPDVESNLFFWGHGLGWVNPYKYSNTQVLTESRTVPQSDGSVSVMLQELYGFGGEYIDETNRKSDYIDIDELAAAVPDGRFDMIWFDCCYMSSIEVAYQFRNKCRSFVAYPTEIMAEGLPYNLVLPKIIGENGNKIEAAKTLYNYYTSNLAPVTVAVMDMTHIEDVADAARTIFSVGNSRPSTGGLQNYSRISRVPYYDFGQYMREYANVNSGSLSQKEADANVNALKVALDKFVLYCEASDVDFNSRPIVKDNFSGISIHNYMDMDTERERYYRELDWFMHVWNPYENTDSWQ